MINYEELQTESHNFIEVMKTFVNKGKLISGILKNRETDPIKWLESYVRWEKFMLIMKEIMIHLEDLEVDEGSKKFIVHLSRYVDSLWKTGTGTSDTKYEKFAEIEESFKIVEKLFINL